METQTKAPAEKPAKKSKPKAPKPITTTARQGDGPIARTSPPDQPET